MSSRLNSPHSSARRTQLLERLVVALTGAPEGDRLPIRTRVLDDPTIALLDAWATVGDVLGFYLDRIADEGYLSTAVDPGSILALAALVGHKPRYGIASKLHLACTLNPDPKDNALQLASGLLFQTVPGAGEHPQTFESFDAIIARPSWNLLAPKTTQPLSVASPASATHLGSLVVKGTTTNLQANDAILLELTGVVTPVPISVASTAVDHVTSLTTVTLQSTAAGSPASGHAAVASGVASVPAQPANVTGAIDGLLSGGLAAPVTPVPASAHMLGRAAKTVFTPGSDSIPRMLSALQPALASTLYAALDTTAVGQTTVQGASALRAKAAPFGAQAPPKQVFDSSGKPAGTVPWPIGDTHTLALSVTITDFERLSSQAIRSGTFRRISRMIGHRQSPPGTDEESVTPNPVVSVQCNVGALTSSAIIEITSPGPWQEADLQSLGSLALSTDNNTLTVFYTGTATSRVPELVITATIDPERDAVSLKIGDETHVWDPNIHTEISTRVGNAMLSIAWAKPPVGESALKISVQTPLPLTDRKRLPLDKTYDTILKGSWVVIERAGDPQSSSATEIKYPLVAQVAAIDSVAVSGYGISGTVTRLSLSADWIGPSDVLQTALKSLTVHAQQDLLTLAPVPVLGDVSGASIELDGLVAGIEAGRLIAVTGTRTDLPAHATVPAGEIAMVESISAGAAAGETIHSTLNLHGPLSYSYHRASLKIYGNVVSARQGATINEILGSGQPAKPHQSFALSTGPMLAETTLGQAGAQSTLTVTVDGVGYDEVERFDATTSPRSFRTGTDPGGKTTVVFATPLPAGTANVRASYRAGDGGQGNVRAGQVTQLLSRPAGLGAVVNPLPGSGGSSGDGPDDVRAAVPVGLGGLGRIVTISDYADIASSWAGVGKASATVAAIDRASGVVVSVAGTAPVPLDPNGSLCTGLSAAIAELADPSVPLRAVPATLFAIVLQASVVHDPLVSWDATVDATRVALLASFGYAKRGLGQDVALSDLIAAAHAVPAVRSFTVTAIALVPATATASELSTKLPAMLTSPVPAVSSLSAAAAEWGLPVTADAPAAVAYLSSSTPDTLILTEQQQ